VNDYKQQHLGADLDSEEIKRQAFNIYEKYVCENSYYQVNLSSENRALVRESILNFDTTIAPLIFDQAQEEIFDLMNADSFPRFIKNVDPNELVEMGNMRPPQTPAASRSTAVPNSSLILSPSLEGLEGLNDISRKDQDNDMD